MQFIDFFADAEKYLAQMVVKLQSQVTKENHLDILEDELLEETRELARLLLQGHIDSRSFGDIGATVITTETVKLQKRKKRQRQRVLKTIFGKISINRLSYSSVGHQSLFPLDALLNLPRGSFSYGLQQMLVREIITGSFEESLLTIERLTSVRIGQRQALEIVKQCAMDFDSFYQETFINTKTDELSLVPIMVLTTDGKGIIMRHDSLREGTRKRQCNTNNKLKHRLSKGEKGNRKRMAQVASIYFIERFVRQPEDILSDLLRKKAKMKRPRPLGKRIWASVEKSTSQVISELFYEAFQSDSKQYKEWVVLVDGQEYQLGEIHKTAKILRVNITIILDLIHVIEYLWDAAHLFFDESTKSCEDWVSSKLLDVLNNQSRKVAGSIRMSAAKRNLSDKQSIQAKTCANYLTKNQEYMDYKTYLQRGYPIGTGVIEGACRYLVKDRMDITGARWGLEGAEAILKLRSISKSHDFEDYWHFHLKQEFGRNYASKYQNIDQISSALS